MKSLSTGLRRTSRVISKRAFTLIEVTLALGVAGFCLVTVFGLLPVGLTSNQASLQQTMAGNISSAIMSDLRSTQSLAATGSPRFNISIPAPTGTTAAAITTSAPQTIYFAANGSPTGSKGAGPVGSGSAVSVYRATLAFGTPASGQRTATPVRVLVTWPAMADSNPSAWPSNFSGSYEAQTTLDRN